MRRVSMGLTFMALCSLAISAAQVKADDKADINAVYGKVTAAMKAKDIKALMATGTPDFTMKDMSGKVHNAKEATEMMGSQFKVMTSVEDVKMTPKSYDIKGKTATVMADFIMKVTMPGPDNKPHKFSSIGLTKDTFVKTPKGWMLKGTEAVKESTLMDGKPMNAAAPPPSSAAPVLKKK